MPSVHGSLSGLQPLIPVSIGRAGGRISDERLTRTGLIDTGATRTCLSRRVIAALGLPVVTRALVASATSVERRKAHAFSLGPFCSVDDQPDGRQTLYAWPEDIVAPDFVESGELVVLIGMDVLSRGMTTFDRTEFSFRF